jgi:hypothetical protein
VQLLTDSRCDYLVVRVVVSERCSMQTELSTEAAATQRAKVSSCHVACGAGVRRLSLLWGMGDGCGRWAMGESEVTF